MDDFISGNRFSDKAEKTPAPYRNGHRMYRKMMMMKLFAGDGEDPDAVCQIKGIKRVGNLVSARHA